MDHKHSPENENTLAPRLKKALPAFGIIALFYLALILLTGYACPIRLLTGISCPGCGTSRAWIRLIKGDAAGAFRVHPLFWWPAAAALLAAADILLLPRFSGKPALKAVQLRDFLSRK